LVRGIVMPRMPGKEIHKLYGPGDRSAEFPQAGWDFLIHVAMNCAAAFETLHEHGVVMADVNEGNLLVKENNGRVGLIDCDSYQIRNGTGYFACDVGIPMWTPPELQGKNFRGLERTPNHDRFGLAVLIFRLLFMGRHPFAGTPTGRDQFEIEEAIKRCLFAFSPQVWSQGIRQPPHSLPLAAVPERLRRLFERAFLPGSTQPNARPPGREWAQELKALLVAVKKSCLDPGHKHWNGLTACPWCAITNSGGPNFFISVAIHVNSADWTADFNKIWASIERVALGALMQEKAVLPALGAVPGRPMPISKPQPPALRAPARPGKPAPLAKPVLLPQQFPYPPALRPPAVLPSIPMGHNERMARLCGLGAVFFGLFVVFCQTMEVEVAKYGAAWALLVCLVTCYLKWSRAHQERSLRRDAEHQARQAERRQAEEKYATELASHEARVAALAQQHATEVANAEAEYQQEWLQRDQEYQKAFNSYLSAQKNYEVAQQQYEADVAQWKAELDQRVSTETQFRQALNSALAQLQAILGQYQDQVRATMPALEAARQRFEKARADELMDLRHLHSQRWGLQLRQFLSHRLLRDADIPGIGSGRKATLAAYNISTAADIHGNLHVPGFGDVLLGYLQSWRRQCEAQFRYNASAPLPLAEVNAVKLKHAQPRQSALAELRVGATMLENLEGPVRMEVSQAKVDLTKAGRAHAQALADLIACS
ncbi:MAG: hypothetical protein KIT22_10605, partial [Verrucomicrobiae bacterium]|nr:hypothetical protein [Verrucomicrobiae bacterium]